METQRSVQKTKAPRLRLWRRKENYIAMQLSNNIVQVNHMSDHVKVVIWTHENMLLMTLINQLNAQTISFVDPCPENIRIKMENTLREVRELSRRSVDYSITS